MQGPFSAIQMQGWYTQGFFSDQLLVRRVDSAATFETLAALVMRSSDTSQPFLSPALPKMFAPPGLPGMGQPIMHSPILNRIASPVLWQHALPSAAVSRPSSGHGSVSNYPDLFPSHAASVNHSHSHGHDHIHGQVQSPQPSLGLRQSMHDIIPQDPWADTLASSPAISASNSQRDIVGSSGITIEPPVWPQSQRKPSVISPVPIPAISAVHRDHQEPIHAPTISQEQQAGQENGRRESHEINPISRQHQLESTASAKASPKAAAEVHPTQQSEIWHTSMKSPAKPEKSTGPSSFPPSTTNLSAVSKPASGEPPVAPVKSAASHAISPSFPSSATLSEHSDGDIWNAVPKRRPTLQTAASQSTEATAASATVPFAAAGAPAATLSSNDGKVSISTPDLFEKQRKGGRNVPAVATDQPLLPSTLTGSSSYTSLSTSKVVPWAKGNDEATASNVVPLPSASGLSLREIQAKEQKETAIRAAAQKREHAAQRAAEEAVAAERLAKEASESLPVTSTWATGSPSAVPAPSASLWNNPIAANTVPAKVVPTKSSKKKTLKEIQEEEEARKKAAIAGAATSGSSGKGYAGSIGMPKSGNSPANSSSGTWTTVGAAKPLAGSPTNLIAASKPSNGSIPTKALAPTSSSSSSFIIRTSSSVPASPSSLSLSGSALRLATNGRGGASAGKASNEPFTPASAELLKWCREALKGLDIPGRRGSCLIFFT